MKIVKEQNQEQTDEVKLLVTRVLLKINIGEAPAEIINLYQNLGPNAFGYWLHGFFCGYLNRKILYDSEIIKFLGKIPGES